MYYELDLTYEDYLEDMKQKQEQQDYQDAVDQDFENYIGEFNE